MKWQDKGYLLSINKYNENSAIAEFFTENNGKVSGVIFGATSKKIKNYLLMGNKFHLNFNFKQDSKLGYFKIEIDKATTPNYLENKKKLFCIIYTMNLIKTLTVDNETNKNIYQLLNNFFELLNKDNWLVFFIFWELNFYKTIGYDIDFKNYVTNTIIDGDEKFIVESTKKTIPNFLVNNDINTKNENDIFSAFKIVGEFLDKSILKPNNISFPSSRIEFGKLIKQI
jgi:DNA repair protein RecO (recombination protein O)|tara:strand:- start:178 stop:858 length:681 start_codon:yes stop_codon:yes gene_type:complete